MTATLVHLIRQDLVVKVIVNLKSKMYTGATAVMGPSPGVSDCACNVLMTTASWIGKVLCLGPKLLPSVSWPTNV